MEIEDFLPKYPNINKKKDNVLNPYEDDFYNAIFRKKEFYDERLDPVEDIPSERGVLMKHQTIIARFLSSHTMYNELLIVHQMGTGKTCSAIGAIEQIKGENTTIKGAYIFASGRNLLNNFKKELRDKCTGGQYVPEGHIEELNNGCVKRVVATGNRLTDLELNIRSRKLYENFYHFTIGQNKPTTFETFAKHLTRLKDSDIIHMYSNNIIVIDEVHNLRNTINNITPKKLFLDSHKNTKIINEIKGKDPKETKKLKTQKLNSMWENLSETNRKEYIELYEKNQNISMLGGFEIFFKALTEFKKKHPTYSFPVMIYNQFYRFLHIVKNCKILLLSGTPMKDNPEEIANVMNLILPLNTPENKENQFKKDTFVSEYLDKKRDNLYYVKTSKIKKLKDKFKGRVSFLKSMKSEIEKVFIGEKNVGSLKHFIVNSLEMSKNQTKRYIEALQTDSKEESGVYLNSRQASLFVFPDGSIGGNLKSKNKEGFAKWITYKKSSRIVSLIDGKKKTSDTYTFKLTKEFKKILKGDTKKETLKGDTHDETLKGDTHDETLKGDKHGEILKNIRKYSIKYATVIEQILKSENQSCFVYCEFVTGGGAILFSLLLKLFGFESASGTQGNSEKLRYGLLTNKTSTPKQISQIINCFNKPANKHGKIIKVIIGSRLVSEGVSFYNIQKEFILTPWFNYSEIDQAIARGYRLGSHKELLKTEEPQVDIYQLVATSSNKLSSKQYLPKISHNSIDLYMYEISEDKDISIKSMMRVLMESAFDCSLNYKRNHITDKDNQRDCEYQNCNYVCDGVDMKYIEDNLPINEMDDSTYQLYYSNPKVLPIRKKLEKLFDAHNNLSIDSIIKFFENEYTEWEIRNAVKTILNKSKENMFYKDYVKLYSKSTISKIIIEIKHMFKTSFRIGINTILNNFKQNTKFEVITALKNMIDENIIIKNKYGLSSYLRENNNIYFLVDNLSISDDSFSDYYTKTPNIVTGKTFDETLFDIQLEVMPSFISKLCKVTKKSYFNKLIRAVPEEIQELLIEAAVFAKLKNVNKNITTREFIIDYFTSYIFDIEDTLISSRRQDENDQLRCLNKKAKNIEDWTDCPPKFDRIIEKQLTDIKDTLETNPWGYYGKYNPETGVFSIVNVKSQLEKFKAKKDEMIANLDALVASGDITEEEKQQALDEDLQKDFRDVFPGKNCKAGWYVPELSSLAIKTLKIPVPADYKDTEKRAKLITTLSKYIDLIAKKYYAKTRTPFIKSKNKSMPKKDVYAIINNEWNDLSDKQKENYYKSDKQLYTKDEIKNLTNEELRRAIYFTHDKNVKTIVGLCKEIQEWFRTTEWNGMKLLIPDKQAGKSGGHTKKDQTTKKKERSFRIEKIKPSDNEEKFKEYLKNIEKLMFECFGIKKYKPNIDSKQWVFVFARKKMVGFIVVNNNIITNVCVAKNYKTMGVAQQVIKVAVNSICTKDLQLIIANTEKSYNKLVKLYKSYGFDINMNDGKNTTMEIK